MAATDRPYPCADVQPPDPRVEADHPADPQRCEEGVLAVRTSGQAGARAACCVLRAANCKRALVAYMAGGLASLVLLVLLVTALGILLHPVIMVTVGVAMGG